jgi:hypothetical protein
MLEFVQINHVTNNFNFLELPLYIVCYNHNDLNESFMLQYKFVCCFFFISKTFGHLVP